MGTRAADETVSRMLRDEWIGKRIRFGGRSGIVRDETMHTFRVEMHNGEYRTIMKSAHTFGREAPEGVVEVEGSLLVRRPHDRLKLRGQDRKQE